MRGVQALLVEQTVAYARTLLLCSEPQRALLVLELAAPDCVIESVEACALAQTIRRSIAHLDSHEAYVARYGAEFKDLYNMEGERAPFSDRGLLHLRRGQFALEAVAAVLRQFPDGATLLAIGCGDCTLENELLTNHPQLRIVVSELNGTASRAAQALADKFPGRVSVTGRVDGEDFETRPVYDLVVCLEVLEHVPDADLLLHNIAASLSPRGTLLLTTPNGADWLEGSQLTDLNKPDFWQQHVRAYSGESLFRACVRAGLAASVWLTLPPEGSLQVVAARFDPTEAPVTRPCDNPVEAAALPPGSTAIVSRPFKIGSDSLVALQGVLLKERV